ncbi:MAG: DUF5107 domain-containing protein [Vallitalea sp.]|jgi:tetratricopeptide (TPR) repeat protein|nr:DUF5107 domain-containing protein [Vallitalea sp.]
MKPKLIFSKNMYECIEAIKESTVPSLCDTINVQNKEKQENRLSEDEGLFIGYGKITGCFPYKEQNQYNTELINKEVSVAVLENDYIKATFLTEYGGRLWELIDKKTGRNLLYTNDVIQPRNLAIRNAWFSGGVEWNIGSIGHSPFTCEKMYVAQSTNDEGIPILRFYEFERIRRVTYQMDFWLEEGSDILFCRMRIDNRSDRTIPMYWWSNIAVPEYEDGRVIVPATSAYKNSAKPGISKVTIPIDNECNQDITYYGDIPEPVDYFFDIAKTTKKYIANVDNTGFGLLQVSSNRLKGRKVFSWGHIQSSDNWQEILTKQAGKYIEIQAGVAKTQYECIPMPPNTAWEWVECYTSISVEPEKVFNEYSDAVKEVDTKVNSIWNNYDLECLVASTKDSIGKKKFKLIHSGSGFGALENKLRHTLGKRLVSDYLDFNYDGNTKDWIDIIENNSFNNIDVNTPPKSFVLGDDWIDILENSSKSEGKDNWYVWYQLGVMYKYNKKYEKALDCFKKSLFIDVNKWAYHALAHLYIDIKETNKAAKYAVKSMELGNADYSLCESCLKLLLNNGLYNYIIKSYVNLADNVKSNSRIKMYLAFAYANTGFVEKADKIMSENGGLVVNDIREGEISITELWILIYKLKNPNVKYEEITVPKKYDFRLH